MCHSNNDIIVLLDGDDYLHSNDVLSYLNTLYSTNSELGLTYGQYIDLKDKKLGCNSQLINSRNYRHSGLWCTSHLRTFKFKYFRNSDR